MKTLRTRLLLSFVFIVLLGALSLAPLRARLASAQSNTITVQVDRPGAAISPTNFGLFFEDINFGADGGLYPERVKNRSFEFSDPTKWFRDNVGRYDDYPRNGPKVFADEYAAQSVGVARPENKNNWECALSEAAFMTGLERNADVVLMSSYAPLFAHVDAWQWTPNLIWFDNLRSYGTPSYYVQKLFGANRGSRVLPVQLNGSAKNGQQNLFASASLDDKAGEVVLKLVNTEASPKEVHINLAGATKIGQSGKAFILASADLKAENSLDEPKKIAPVERQFATPSGDFNFILEPNSLTVVRIPAR
jgi:alpha-N-arabinofuranosidase